MMDFVAWPKTPRLFRDMIVTEKIDGTNAAIIIEAVEPGLGWKEQPARAVEIDGVDHLLGAQSRKRLITPDDDNFGFARWVWENAEDLVHALGPGRHYGEWWGSGIQRGYGLRNGEKRFSLFNVVRYGGIAGVFKELDVVPTLYKGPFDLENVNTLLDELRETGSVAAPGFRNPEGVVVFHEAAGQVFKATLDNDGIPKSQVEAA